MVTQRNAPSTFYLDQTLDYLINIDISSVKKNKTLVPFLFSSILFTFMTEINEGRKDKNHPHRITNRERDCFVEKMQNNPNSTLC